MTASERRERNETILRGEKPGPTRLQEWCHENEKHWARPIAGLIVLGAVTAVIGVIAGAVWISITYPHVAVWTLAPTILLALAYGLGMVVEKI